MREREPLVAGGLVALLLVLWLGFLVHRDPRFAGSGWGGALGVAGATLMLVSYGYSLWKRCPTLKRGAAAGTALRWHAYAGLFAAILGVLHTGHKFDSPLGVALTAAMLVVVLSGYVGRHLMRQIALDVNEKKALLARLEAAYRQTAGDLAADPTQVALVRPWSGFWGRLVIGLAFDKTTPLPAAARAVRVAESIADLEYAIKTDDTLRRRFAAWQRVHVVASALLAALLGLHVWAGIHYGLRWWS